ncbi:MAG: hypothetical protein KBA53_10795 [Thermoclostridium sp.]|nr:hypothetical protein [Thermoclostridium sp.]
MFVALGLIGAFVAAVLVVAIHSFTSFDLSSFSLFFVVPVGAIVTGGLGTLGYYLGVLKTNIKITKAIKWTGIVIALVCFILVQYGFYYTAYLDENMDLNFKMQGEHISLYAIGESDEPINFFTFTQEMVNSRVISFSRRGRQLFEVEGNKVVNWIFYLVDFLGVLLGAFFARFLVIGNKKYCDNCKRYMKQKDLLKFSVQDTERVIRFKNITQMQPQEISALVHSDGIPVEGEHYDIHLDWCKECNAGFIQLKYMELDSKNKPSHNEGKSIEIPVDSKVTQAILQQ